MCSPPVMIFATPTRRGGGHLIPRYKSHITQLLAALNYLLNTIPAEMMLQLSKVVNKRESPP